MEPERDGVVRNNGPPIIGILKYYALARLLLLRSDPESCWSVRGHIGLESWRSRGVEYVQESAKFPFPGLVNFVPAAQ